MYQIFYLHPHSCFLVLDKTVGKHSGWKNPISNYLFHSVPKSMQGSADNTLLHLIKVNRSSKVYYLGEYISIPNFYIANPHLFV